MVAGRARVPLCPWETTELISPAQCVYVQPSRTCLCRNCIPPYSIAGQSRLSRTVKRNNGPRGLQGRWSTEKSTENLTIAAQPPFSADIAAWGSYSVRAELLSHDVSRENMLPARRAAISPVSGVRRDRKKGDGETGTLKGPRATLYRGLGVESVQWIWRRDSSRRFPFLAPSADCRG